MAQGRQLAKHQPPLTGFLLILGLALRTLKNFLAPFRTLTPGLVVRPDRDSPKSQNHQQLAQGRSIKPPQAGSMRTESIIRQEPDFGEENALSRSGSSQLCINRAGCARQF